MYSINLFGDVYISLMLLPFFSSFSRISGFRSHAGRGTCEAKQGGGQRQTRPRPCLCLVENTLAISNFTLVSSRERLGLLEGWTRMTGRVEVKENKKCSLIRKKTI